MTFADRALHAIRLIHASDQPCDVPWHALLLMAVEDEIRAAVDEARSRFADDLDGHVARAQALADAARVCALEWRP